MSAIRPAKLLAEPEGGLNDRVRIERRPRDAVGLGETGEQGVLHRAGELDLAAEGVGPAEIPNTDAGRAGHLVGVTRADAAAGGADLLAGPRADTLPRAPLASRSSRSPSSALW